MCIGACLARALLIQPPLTCAGRGVRVPLIMRAPWLPRSAGARTSTLAELVDIMPTLAEMSGAPLSDAGPSPDPNLLPAPPRRHSIA